MAVAECSGCLRAVAAAVVVGVKWLCGGDPFWLREIWGRGEQFRKWREESGTDSVTEWKGN